MPTHALIATQLTDRSAQPFSLTMGGANVIRYTEIGSIFVDEQGPGGVSAMSFTVIDPNLAVGLPQEGDEVEFWDVDYDRPIFAGFIQSWVVRTYGMGRSIEVQCMGVEAILDWVITEDTVLDTLASGLDVGIQAVAAGAGLNTTRTNGVADGNQSSPVGDLDEWVLDDRAGGGVTVTIPSGRLRDALRDVSFNTVWDNVPADARSVRPYFTVDFYRGLRAWRGPNLGTQVVSDEQKPADYDNLTVTNTTVGDPSASDLQHEVDIGGLPHQVYVRGGTAAGTGLVGDGTGIRFPIAEMSDAEATTASLRDDIGRAFLGEYGASVRGTVELSNFNPSTSNVRAGSMLILTDARTGATGTYRIASIQKRFHATAFGVRQDWQIAYGGRRPSAMRELRVLTS